jgi:hypothetical protein
MSSTNQEETAMQLFEELFEMSRNAKKPQQFREYADFVEEAANLVSDNKWAPRVAGSSFINTCQCSLSGYEHTAVRPTLDDWKTIEYIQR